MTEYHRPQYEWRLLVEYPSGPLNDEQQRWMGREDCWTDYFVWPSHRRYLSERAANKRANLLRSYGATVVVQRSYPIVWQS